MAREDVDRADDIPVGLCPTPGTTVGSVPLLFLVQTPGTGFAEISFIHQLDLNPHPSSFVSDLLPQLAVWPLADFLLAFSPEPFTIANIPHITEGDPADPAFQGEVDHRPADFVQDVPAFAFNQGQEIAFAPLQPPPAPGILEAVTLGFLKLRQPLVAILVQGA